MLPLLTLAWLAVAQDPAAAGPVPAAGAGPVVVVRLEGQLDESWASILRRVEERATALDASAVVFELDTPGGQAELMKRLGDRMDRIGQRRATVCLIDRRALSAGAYLAMSCQEIWMVPAATIGSATPISIGPGGIPLPVDEDVQEKTLSYFRAEFRSWAELHGRDPGIAEAFVDNKIELQRVSVRGQPRIVNREEYDQLIQQGEQPSFLEMVCASGELLALTSQEALELGFCDGIVPGRDALLASLGWQELPVVVVEANWSEQMVQGLGSWSWLLMLAAAFFLVISFQMPGLGAPEVAAVICIVVFLFHGYLVGLAEWTEILLVLGGLALLAVEVFVLPGTFIAGICGLLLLLGGLVLAMQEFILPEGAIEMGVFQDNLLRLLLLILVAPVVGMFLVRRFTRTRAGSFMTNAPSADFAGSVAGNAGGAAPPAVAAGTRGRCLTPLRPSGRIEVDGEPYDALSQGDFLNTGQPVRVLGRHGISLLVALDEEPTA
ncbi:MAG: hypothetical protein ISR76_08595 [Planctomycetes bacterium]|nr:hypothetical protein [Planctomycetota bacterium]